MENNEHVKKGRIIMNMKLKCVWEWTGGEKNKERKGWRNCWHR